MIRALSLAIGAAALAATTAAAQPGFGERAGLGLRPGMPAADPVVSGGELAPVQWSRLQDYTLAGSAREQAPVGIYEPGAYGGAAQSFFGRFGSSFEAGYAQESLSSPRRYVLTGQLHSELDRGRTLSLGLQYRTYEGEYGTRAPDAPFANGYSLAPAWLPASAYSPSYQLQFSYQHSPASVFGLAFGRDVETYTPYLESTGARQLTFTGQHWLTASWAVSYDLLSYDLARPQNLRLGLGMRYRW